ncbi:fibronectin type III domain-containing protein [Tunicatimonas pelagia]|uniref:fibronectin type III domain-containing protein n=1 Tax=Tunicatimonas pelagia TaxID=931531 RepID=UPI002666240D|nr:fibronectin type III domain-containing protein [Tunicatimonas pelagia]WKN45339.1 fibronectin type III domain-containing protein [Tunicatimonas pelagia]
MFNYLKPLMPQVFSLLSVIACTTSVSFANDTALNSDGATTIRLDEAVRYFGRADLPFPGTDAGKQNTGLRLVSHGKIRESGQERYSVWRIRNATNEVKSVVLKAHGNSAEQSLSIPAHTETFVRSGHYQGSATHRLFYQGRQIDVKASSPSDFSDSRLVRHPGAPNESTNLVAQAASDREIYLTWKDQSDNERGFAIERRPEGSGAFQRIFTTRVNEEAFLDTTLVSGVTYQYRIQAVNGDWVSNYSDTTAATTMLVSPVTYYAIASNDWTTPLTWSHTKQGPPTVSTPHEAALVFINGHAISLDGDQLCTKLSLDTEGTSSLLTIEGATLTVRDRVTVEKNCEACISNIIINNKGRLHCENP